MQRIRFLFAVVSHLIPSAFANKGCAGVCQVCYRAKPFGEVVTETMSVCDRLFAEPFLCAYGTSQLRSSHVTQSAVMLDEGPFSPRRELLCAVLAAAGAGRSWEKPTQKKKGGKTRTGQMACGDGSFLLAVSDSAYYEFFH